MLLRNRLGAYTFRAAESTLLRNYVSVPDLIFGEDEVTGDQITNPKNAKNPFIARKINGRFVGPWSRDSNKKFSDTLRLFFSKNNPRFKNPKKYENRELLKPLEVDTAKLNSTEQPHITWMGHASCYYNVDGVNFLTDPVWDQRASPFSFIGPKRFYDPCIPLESLKIDVVLLSHTHYDHLDIPSARRIGNKAHWVVPLGVKEILAKEGITNCTELDWWSTYHYLSPTGKTFEITFAPAKHWTARGLFDRNTCLWGSFIVKSNKFRFFFTGDTAYCEVFKAIGDTHGPFDFSAIAIGAYSPRWFMKDVHCNPEEAVKIHLDLRSKQSLGVHWGTFRLTEEDPIEPALELARARELHKVSAKEFFTTIQGATMTFGAEPQYDIATLHNDLYGHYLEQLRNSPALE